MVFQFKIQIKGITKPAVWRKVSVPANFTFLRFHDVIQTVFGWEDYHLFEFKDKEWQSNIRIAVPVEDDFFDPDFFADTKDSSKIKLSDIFNDKFRKLLYVYDFGDNWVHEITLESISNDKQKTAVCLSGKGACPPEDCGSIYGYEGLKEVFATMPESEEAEEYRDWLGLEDGENWDTDAFDIDEVNNYLKQV
ncbi:plasmid pRiA4b ORF-3 family protein [Dysgonomonas sp. GY75]|jgi:hypothetical protein|uniref:plasmid pRiA4b ORF-3 family protein n=1 Tax=Dysgonomonas sp. GY75 TaxID=2780419 RepID=UPI0018832C08|nr:plasmid pRiA4b ORF-3 family protein [Dysgonomonas sp. GY75]MBF0650802.1 plasmid pRiA4b ORF-3 family protein [Dysgonomonas sp. GY75]